MVEVNILPATAFEAIAVAQATYGVPDQMIAQIAQCSITQIYRNRVKAGRKIRKLSLAYLRGQAPVIDGATGEAFDQNSAGSDMSTDGLRGNINRLLMRMNNEMALDGPEEIDPLALKRIEALGAMAKQIERMVELRLKLTPQLAGAAILQEPDPQETARVLKKISKRVDELATRKAQDMVNGMQDADRPQVPNTEREGGAIVA